MSFAEDKPTSLFLAKLAAFNPQYAATACVKEMVELLVILSEAPVLVQDGIDGFLKGTYADRMFNQSVPYFLPEDPAPGTRL
jgi:hypothetical protein